MASLFPRFERVDVEYKALNGTSFPAAILVPKNLILNTVSRSCPLLVHFHGGGLYVGTNLDPFFLSKWPLELAEAESAIIVSPQYRLLPEATGAELLDDIKDFWDWVGKSLPRYITEKWPGLTLDLSRTAVFGESAGGYLSLQSAFLFPSAQIKAVLAQYPAIHPDIALFKPRPAVPSPDAEAILDAYIAHIKPGAIRLSSPFPALMDIAQALNQTYRYRGWLGDDKRLTLNHGLTSADKIPPIWILQGVDDTIVVKEATDELVARTREIRPETELLYSVQPGEHGFDSPFGLDEPCIAEGIEFVKKYWP